MTKYSYGDIVGILENERNERLYPNYHYFKGKPLEVIDIEKASYSPKEYILTVCKLGSARKDFFYAKDVQPYSLTNREAASLLIEKGDT